MREARLQVPVPWEHQDDAKPVSRGERLAARVKRNAGFLKDLYLTRDGALWGDIDIADPAVAKHIHRNVRYVSPEIESEFTDGDGTRWKDVITHLALTPRPVFQRQKPFGEPPPPRLSLARVTTIRLSMEQLTTMATRKKKTPAKAPATVTPEAEANKKKNTRANAAHDNPAEQARERARLSRRRMSDDEEERQEDEDAPEEEEEDEIALSEDEAGEAGPETPEDYLQECVKLLGDKGVHLPEHTSTETFMRDLVVALHAITNSEGGEDQMSEDSDEEDDDLMVGDGDDVQGEAQRERPLALSLQRRVKEQERQIADLIVERELTRLNRFEREGRCSPVKARELRSLIGRKRMSFASNTGDAQVVKAQLDMIADNPKGTFSPGGRDTERLSHADNRNVRTGPPSQRQARRTAWESDPAVTPDRAREAAEEQLRNSGVIPR